MEPVQNQNPQPPPPIFNPQPIIPAQQLPVQSFQPAPPPKKSYWKIILGSLTSLVLIFVLTFGYFFWWAPETAAKEFI